MYFNIQIKIIFMKKIIFWIDGNLSTFCIAKKIKDDIGSEIHGIFNITNKPKKFIQNQKLIDWKSVNFYHDNVSDLNTKPDLDYLRQKEQEYNLNLMMLLLNDRSLYNFNDFYQFSTNQVLRLIELEIKFFEKILNEIKPDYLIMNPVFLRPGYLFYLMCKEKKINILIPVSTRLHGRVMISDDWDDLGYKNNIYDDNDNNQNLETIHKKFDLKEEVIETSERFLQSKSLAISALFSYIFSKNTNVNTHYTYFGRSKFNVLKNYFFDSLRTKQRKSFIDKNFSHTIENDTKFVYFPLHIEQEQVILIHAPYHTNQLEIIRHVAKSLPINYKLVIKEHPMMYTRSWRNIDDYKEILKLPNTVLIHPSADSTEILKNCDLTISIKSSTSFEAGYYNKPAIVFSKTSWSMLPHISIAKSFSDLPYLIQNSLNKKVSQNEFSKYIKYLEKNSFEFNADKFSQDFSDFFNFGGYLVDVDITEEKMMEFYKKSHDQISILAEKFEQNIVV